MIISIIAAADEMDAMGTLDNTLPWRQDGHWRRLAQLVDNQAVIIGRNAWQGRDWPELVNSRVIVLSRKLKQADHPDIRIRRTFDAAIHEAQRETSHVYVIGGCETIGLAMAWADQIYLTRVHHSPSEPGHLRFPKLRTDEWERRVASGPYRISHDNQHEFTLERWETITWLSRQKNKNRKY